MDIILLRLGDIILPRLIPNSMDILVPLIAVVVGMSDPGVGKVWKFLKNAVVSIFFSEGCSTNYGKGPPCQIPYKIEGQIYFSCTNSRTQEVSTTP